MTGSSCLLDEVFLFVSLHLRCFKDTDLDVWSGIRCSDKRTTTFDVRGKKDNVTHSRRRKRGSTYGGRQRSVTVEGVSNRILNTGEKEHKYCTEEDDWGKVVSDLCESGEGRTKSNRPISDQKK